MQRILYIVRLIAAFLDRFKALIIIGIVLGVVFFLILNLILPKMSFSEVKRIGY